MSRDRWAMRQIRTQHDDEQRTAAPRTPTRPNCSPTAANGKSAQMHRDVAAVGERPLQPALAEDAARADGPDGVVDLVHLLLQLRVVLVEEHPHAGQLVRVDEAGRRTRRRRVATDSRLIVTMYRALAPATSSTPIAMAISTDAEPRSGWTMISTAGMPTMISAAEEARRS